ncbi:MAG: hypothetical protein HQ541_21330 [Mariniphaga sp.]|nr:hypothetical protein [Mariniphaga sp.]
MKNILLLWFFLISFFCFSQDKEFLLHGRILDSNSNPVENAYIINFRDLSTYASRQTV